MEPVSNKPVESRSGRSGGNGFPPAAAGCRPRGSSPGTSEAAVDLDPSRPLVAAFHTAKLSWSCDANSIPPNTAVDADWTQRLARAPHLWRGEIVDAVLVEQRGTHAEFTIRRGDFAQYLYERDGTGQDPLVHVLYASALVTTGDGSLILVESSAQSAAPGTLGLPGGNVDAGDVRTCSEEDFELAAVREAAEELGIVGCRRDERLSLLLATGARASVGVVVPLTVRASDAEVLSAVDATGSAEIEAAHFVAKEGDARWLLGSAPTHAHLEPIVEWWRKATT